MIAAPGEYQRECLSSGTSSGRLGDIEDSMPVCRSSRKGAADGKFPMHFFLHDAGSERDGQVADGPTNLRSCCVPRVSLGEAGGTISGGRRSLLSLSLSSSSWWWWW
jgi:hypothetical protein